jgi:hypothetical protein
MERERISGNVVEIRQRIKEGKLYLDQVDPKERASVESIATAILKWPGMTNDIEITGVDGKNGFTTLSIKGFKRFTSIVDWCREFHNSGNPQYNLLTDTLFVGELQLFVKKMEHPEPPPQSVSENGKYTERLKKVHKRIPIHNVSEDDDDDDNRDSTVVKKNKHNGRAYIPPQYN